MSKKEGDRAVSNDYRNKLLTLKNKPNKLKTPLKTIN
jgi:hypothetical protein